MYLVRLCLLCMKKMPGSNTSWCLFSLVSRTTLPTWGWTLQDRCLSWGTGRKSSLNQTLWSNTWTNMWIQVNEKICLFVWVFSSHSRIFHSYAEVTIAGGGLQIFSYARHSWPLISEGSLACNTYCDTGHPLIMVISEDPWHSHLLPSVWQWSCHYLFLRLRSVAAGIGTPNLPFAKQTF